MKSYSMLRTERSGYDHRYYVDGKRVTRDLYRNIDAQGRMFGRQECFSASVESNGRIYYRHEVRL